MKEEKKSLFDVMYDGCKEEIKKINKPRERKALKRKFRSGHDDAQNNIEQANLVINEKMQNITDLDINGILQLKQDIRTLELMKIDIADLYTKLFNEKFNPDIE